jgi:protein-S-isoprenylcysteine O-methyltransferase Ste14
LTIPLYLAFLDIASIAPAIVLGYYAVRMLIMSRMGRLENGWRLITFGAILFTVGFLSLTLQDLTMAYTPLYFVSDYIGTGFSFAGLLLFMLGFRSHYRVWSLKSFRARRSEKTFEKAS